MKKNVEWFVEPMCEGEEEDGSSAFVKAKKLHQDGDLDAAEAQYEAARTTLRVQSLTPPWEADLLRMLGALLVQRIFGPETSAKRNCCAEDQVEGTGAKASKILTSAEQRKCEEALRHIERAVELRPNDAKFAHSLGVARSKLGACVDCEIHRNSLLEGALEAFQRAADLSIGKSKVSFLMKAQGVAKIIEKKKLPVRRKQILRSVLDISPEDPKCHYLLGLVLQELKENNEALLEFETHLRIMESLSRDAQYKVASAKHWAAVLRGETTAGAPEEYVSDLFDTYAKTFEDHLVNVLKYQTPKVLQQQLAAVLGTLDDRPSLGRVVDLGCGTGLMGPLVKELGTVERLEGIDLSAQMLVKAKEKGVYDVLRRCNLEEAFVPCSATVSSQAPEFTPEIDDRFGVVVAADVFVYVGDLSGVFKVARQWMHPRGLFGFSVEDGSRDQQACESLGYRLMDTGRYTHSSQYIRTLARENRFEISSQKAVILRYNGGEPVHGRLFVLTPSAA